MATAEDVTTNRPGRLPLLWWVLRGLAMTIVRVLGRWRVTVAGLEHVPVTGGAVLAFNHHSHFDFVMVALDIVRKRHRPVRFLAKREIWGSRWAGWIVRMAGAVPVDREDRTSRTGAFEAAIATLARGELVAVAPEQTISPSYELLPMRTGAARMALGAGVPLIPVIGWGTQRFATKGHRMRLVRRLPVHVVYGEPLIVLPGDDPVEVTERLQEVMGRMLHEVQDRYPEQGQPGDDWWVPARLGGSAPNHADVLAEHQERFGEQKEGG